MTFKHKLSCRLALMKDRAWPAAALAAVAVLGCERPVAVTDPGATLAQFFVTPQTATLQQNATQDFTAVGLTTAGDTASIDVAWSATGGAIDTSSNHGRHYGHYHATACGDYTVTATSNPGGKNALASVSVLCAGAVPVDTVLVSPPTASLTAGNTVQLSALVEDSAGNPLAGRAVTWTSNSSGVASVSASGLVQGVTAGSATISATSGGKTGTAAITVQAVPVALVTVSPASVTVLVGQTVQLTATPKDAGGNPLAGRSVAWSSGNATVATVSGSGLVTARAAGSTTITATSEGQSGTASLTVSVVPVASVTVSPASAGLLRGVVQRQHDCGHRRHQRAGDGTGRGLDHHHGDERGTEWHGVTDRDRRTSCLCDREPRVGECCRGEHAAAQCDRQGLSRESAQRPDNHLDDEQRGSGRATSGGKSGTAAIVVTAAPPPGSCVSACHYVDVASGNDGNAGTSTAPWRTLQHAADVTNPGDTVIVNDGVYTGGGNVVTISRSGTAAGWLVFRSANLWGAVIDGQNNASAVGIEINGNYVRVEGFEVRNTSRYGIDAYGGSESVGGNHDVDVVQNHIHDIGHICTGDVGGIVGVDAYSDNLTIERNVVHDVGRLGPGEQGCVEPNANWQNHDHGVYHGIGNNVVIRNNVFYNFTHGWAIQRYNGNGAVTTGLTIVNNTFAFPNPWRDGQIIIATGVTNLLIANNIFYQPTTAGVWLDTGGLTNATVSNNIAFGAVASTGSGATLSANMNNTDPQFVNAGGLDFRVQAGSPAIGAGLPLTMVPNDITGALRPATGGYTIGAYEFK